MTVGKIFEFPSEPDQTGLSSSIRLKIYDRTNITLQILSNRKHRKIGLTV